MSDLNGPVHTTITASDERPANVGLNSTVQVRVSSVPALMGVGGSAVTITEVGSGTERSVEKYIRISLRGWYVPV